MIFLFALIATQFGQLFADDDSARRYAMLNRDAVTLKYFLLSTKQVQDDLKLAPQQVKLLEFAISSSPTNIPDVAELHRSQKQLLDAAKSDEERKKIRRDGNEKKQLLIHQNWEATIQSVLSPVQVERLDELFLQMRGPNAILEDTNLVALLHLTKEQTNQMNEVSNSYRQFLPLLQKRLLGLQIQTIRKRNSADVDSEINCLVQVTKEVEKDQDFELLTELGEDQRLSWNNLCGAHLPINWKMDYFSDAPFQQSATMMP